MCFNKVEFTLGIVEETCVLTSIKYHLTDCSSLEEKGGVGIEDSFGRTEGIDEVACSDGAYATDGIEDEKRNEGVHVFVGGIAAIDGCDKDALRRAAKHGCNGDALRRAAKLGCDETEEAAKYGSAGTLGVKNGRLWGGEIGSECGINLVTSGE